MSAPTLKLKSNATARILTGHPWVFANEVESLLPAEYVGEVVMSAGGYQGKVSPTCHSLQKFVPVG